MHDKDLEKQREAACDELTRALHKCATLTGTASAFSEFVAGLSISVFMMTKLGVSADEIIEAMRQESIATMPRGEA